MAGMFPILHLGRPWFFYWLFPYPNIMNVWPQWRSPLVWDFFAIWHYLVVSLLFWYIGLIPDLATLRDRATSRCAAGRLRPARAGLARRGAALGSASRARHLLLAGLAAPLVFSVHSVVALDFATATRRAGTRRSSRRISSPARCSPASPWRWRLAIPLRRVLRLEAFITDAPSRQHGEADAGVRPGRRPTATWSRSSWRTTAPTVTRSHGAEPHARAVRAGVLGRRSLCNVVVPQALWSARTRAAPWALFAHRHRRQVGMWLERFMLIVTSLNRDFLPSAWGMFYPTFWDWHLAGSIGLFVLLFLLFLRVLPAISIARDAQARARQGGPLMPDAHRYGVVARSSPRPRRSWLLRCARAQP